jgi:hypothetical protein
MSAPALRSRSQESRATAAFRAISFQPSLTSINFNDSVTPGVYSIVRGAVLVITVEKWGSLLLPKFIVASMSLMNDNAVYQSDLAISQQQRRHVHLNHQPRRRRLRPGRRVDRSSILAAGHQEPSGNTSMWRANSAVNSLRHGAGCEASELRGGELWVKARELHHIKEALIPRPSLGLGCPATRPPVFRPLRHLLTSTLDSSNGAPQLAASDGCPPLSGPASRFCPPP